MEVYIKKELYCNKCKRENNTFDLRQVKFSTGNIMHLYCKNCGNFLNSYNQENIITKFSSNIESA